jgi:isoleucyl-tRNA synthetase
VPFGPVDPALDLPGLEERLLARWQADDLFGQVQAHRAGGTPWIFYEGPPTANGRPGLHHVWARVFKDLYPRFQTMRGHAVPRQAGWDSHGLPVEIEVEKELGLRSKHDIEAYGVAAFNARCRESVSRYVEDWIALTERSGIWFDNEHAYWTMNNSFIESVWWLVRQLWDAGLLYEGHRVTPYCARCGTALSSHELGQPGVYQEVVDPSVFVRFPVVGRDVDLLVWTTTPWTLVSNVAVAVGPDIRYVRVTSPDGGRDLVVAADAAERRWPDAQPIETWTGRELAGWRYRRPFELLPLDAGGGSDPGDGADAPAGAGTAGERVVTADFVATDEGSGLVHLAPAFGEDDALIGREEGLPVLNPVGPDGTFDERVAPWAGLFVKDADAGIIADLRARGLLVAEEPYEHSYPHCWRCGTPLLYWAKTSWFVRTSARRDDLLRENERIGWHPEHIKHGRFGKWLEGNVDWALSRDRYWGTPLPIWRCDQGHDTCIGSVADLEALADRGDLSGLDLHRPAVDEVTFPCPVAGCGSTATRLAPVLDAWFDSGSMPSAQHHAPFEHEDRFRASFPADFICEAIDQTRGWFYSLLAVNTLVFGSTPYRNVVCLGLVVDAEGQKMSKSRGNVADAWEIFARHGSDAVRWYFFSNGSPWTARRISDDGIRESARTTLFTLWNVLSFFATYADLDGWSPAIGRDGEPGAPADAMTGSAAATTPSHVLDRWVRSELHETTATVTAALDDFDALAASTRLARFIDDLSNWYLRRSRRRFWKQAEPAAHATLHHALVTTARLLAPFCPFLADEAHRVLCDGRSVHLADWPEAEGEIDPDLTERMAAARRLVTLGRAARSDAKVKVRQPLRRALLLHPGVELDEAVRAEIRDELNVRSLEDVDTLSGLITWEVVPNFRALGPRLGPRVADVKSALAAANGSALQRELEVAGAIEVAGIRLSVDEVEVRARRHESFALAEDGGWAVALDLELDGDLRREGVARELIRALNDLRKERGLLIADRIRLRLGGDDAVRAAVEEHAAWIADEVLAVELTWADGGELTVRVDETDVSVALEPAV